VNGSILELSDSHAVLVPERSRYHLEIMTKPTNRDLFYKLYIEAHNNAVQLIHDAETLFEKGRYPRAYSLAFTALEEIAKSQLAADVYTGLQSE
jgi:predicted S18 family serine protease